MKDHLLFLNTADFKCANLALVGEKRVFGKSITPKRGLSEELLSEIIKLLARHKIGLENLKRIAVVTGPGSFSGLRTGLSTANALAYALKIPMIGLRAKEVPVELLNLLKTPASVKLARPFYGMPPHITKQKRADYQRG